MYLLLQLYKFDNFYQPLHVCSRQTLLCAGLAACHVPLVRFLGTLLPPESFRFYESKLLQHFMSVKSILFSNWQQRTFYFMQNITHLPEEATEKWHCMQKFDGPHFSLGPPLYQGPPLCFRTPLNLGQHGVYRTAGSL